MSGSEHVARIKFTNLPDIWSNGKLMLKDGGSRVMQKIVGTGNYYPTGKDRPDNVMTQSEVIWKGPLTRTENTMELFLKKALCFLELCKAIPFKPCDGICKYHNQRNGSSCFMDMEKQSVIVQFYRVM